MVELGYPFESCKFDGLLGFPRGAAVNQFSLVQPVDGLGKGVVVAVSTTAHRGFYPGLGKTLGVENEDIVLTPVRVMDQ